MTTRIKLRRDTADNWGTINPVLALGEPGYDTTNNKLKIGDGVTAWQDLSYLTDATGGGGSGAPAAAVVSANVITSVYITSPGTGYTTSPTFTITDANTTPGSGVSIIYNGEDKKSGGNSNVRYMTRKITLADGFDSGDLRVYLTAYKPNNSNIRVYYKLLSTSDAETFDDKNWQLMTEIGNANFASTNANDYRELSFAPGVNGAANNSVVYTSGSTAYRSFRTFAIKVVMTTNDNTTVPFLTDIRALALPSGTGL